MTAFQILTDLKFETPNQLLNYFTYHKIPFKVDPDTKDRIYALNPNTHRSYTFFVKENNNKLLYLEKE